MAKKLPIKDIVSQAGGTCALARELEISSQAISQWEQVPVKHVLAVEKLTGISRHKMRPDIYGMAP